jgi:osmotically-inducible protein OsmY
MISTLLCSRRTPSHLPAFLALSGLLALGGCRERGSDLVQDQGPERANSAAVANQATAPQRLEAPSDLSAPSSGSSAAGVERGFADASGGQTLPHQASAPSEPSSAPGGSVEAQVQAAVAEMGNDARGATVRVAQGRVVLQGTVASREVKDQLISKVREVRGVEEVDDQLEVRVAQPAE